MSKGQRVSEEHQLDADPAKLKEVAAAAVKERDYVRACRMYTFAIDLLLQPGGAEEEGHRDWASSTVGQRGCSMCCSPTGPSRTTSRDWAAAADAEHCVCASPTFVKGHLRRCARSEAQAPAEERARVIARC